MKDNITVTRPDSCSTVIKISGRFDFESTPRLEKICKKITSDMKVLNIVLDFKDVSGVDSSAFACMINFMKNISLRGRSYSR